ncbi:MAG: hypothetical protein IT510_17720 [Sulfuritalea sp.]|nr:hypothetical protein [Sulfuritalea sp.]
MSDIARWYEMALHAIAAESHHDIKPNLIEALSDGNNRFLPSDQRFKELKQGTKGVRVI